jgi:hypothetical protein
MYQVEGYLLSRQYKNQISDYQQWEQKHHACEYVLYRQNLSHSLSMDETSLSQGELYTLVTNKEGKGRQGSLVAMIKGIKAEDVIYSLQKLPRSQVKEITITHWKKDADCLRKIETDTVYFTLPFYSLKKAVLLRNEK